MPSFTRFIDRPPEYDIREGIVHVMVAGEELCCSSIRTFRAATLVAEEAIARYDAERGDIVRMRARG